MELTRDVILDLLSLVEAGEASADTRTLVERRLAEDPELARIARARAPRLSAIAAPAPLDKETEMRTLERAKRMVSWRSLLIALGVFFAVFPFTYSGATHEWRWMLLQSPLSALLSVVLAAACWAAVFTIWHRLRARRS